MAFSVALVEALGDPFQIQLGVMGPRHILRVSQPVMRSDSATKACTALISSRGSEPS